jgi:hypothetical protein
LFLSKTLTLKGFEMNPEQLTDDETPIVPAFPAFVNGKPVLHARFRILGKNNDGYFKHIFVTRNAGKLKEFNMVTAVSNQAGAFVLLEAITVDAYTANGKAKDALDLQVEMFTRFEAELNRLKRDGYRLTHCDGFSSNVDNVKHSLIGACKGHPQAPGAQIRFVIESDAPVKSDVPATRPITRLSKEEWLKQNYPELSELPKWRFGDVATVGISAPTSAF